MTLDDAPRLGMTRRGLSEYGRRHGWPRPYPGVLLAPGVPHTFAQCLMIAVAAAGGAHVLASRPV